MKAREIDYKKVSLKTPSKKVTTELEILRKNIVEREKDKEHIDRDCKVLKILSDTFSGIYETAFSNCSFVEKKLVIRSLEDIFAGRPLSPLENNEDDWAQDEYEDGTFYHKRYRSLWKIPDGDGWRYSDRKRVIGVERESKYQSQMLVDIIDEIRPITFPYMPQNEPYIVRTASFCLNPEATTPMRKFDHLQVLEYLDPRTGYWKAEPIDRYFIWNDKGERSEITFDEYSARWHKKIKEGETSGG